MPSTDNPFDHSRLARLEYRFPAGQSWQTLLARCAATEYCCAIVGPPGSGKRLLLHELAARLAALGFRPRPFRLTLETRRADKDALLAEVREMRAPDLLFLDGAEHLQTREWLPLRTAINGLAGAIITLHRTGRLPTLLDTTTSPALLAELGHAGGRPTPVLMQRVRALAEERGLEIPARRGGGGNTGGPAGGISTRVVYRLPATPEPKQVNAVTARFGITDGVTTEVIDGLAEGDAIVTSVISAAEAAPAATSSPFGAPGRR